MNGQETWSSEWLDLAEMDLGAAEYLLGMRPVPVEIICYHCEQAAEKMLKGTLAQFGMEPPKTHDLIQLCKLCMERDPQFEQLADACVELTPYGVQVRYPSHMELDESDMNCALRECRKIREFVLQRLDPHISQDIKAVTEALVGEEALEQLDKYNFTKGFFGTNGIDLKRGFTTPDQKEAAVKKKAMEQCQKTYILSDASKFNVISTIKFADLKKAEIITDHLENKEFKRITNIEEVFS